MKKYLLILFCVCAVYFIAAADEIHLTDGTVIKGKVLQVSDTEVRYGVKMESPENGVPVQEEKTVPSVRVVKIVYDNGAEFAPGKSASVDRLFLWDGHILRGE